MNPGFKVTVHGSRGEVTRNGIVYFAADRAEGQTAKEFYEDLEYTKTRFDCVYREAIHDLIKALKLIQ